MKLTLSSNLIDLLLFIDHALSWQNDILKRLCQENFAKTAVPPQ